MEPERRRLIHARAETRKELEAKIVLPHSRRAPRPGLEREVMAPRSYDDSEDPLMGRLVEIATGEGRWRAGVIAFCETTLDGSKGAEVSTGRYRVAWGRFESKTQFLDVVAKKNTLKVRVFRLGYVVRSATPRERRPRRPAR